ncbi:LysM domain-containing protein [Nocardioides sp. J9]|nr:LysM domain-containing protein [Nocardioides sp. J9]
MLTQTQANAKVLGMRGATTSVRQRAAALWLAVTAAVTAALALVGPAAARPLREPSDAEFADLVVAACGAAAVVASLLLWTSATDVAWSLLRAPGGTGPGGRRVGPVRTALLALCGVAGVAVTAAPATAGGGDVPAPGLAGLPLPDRANGTDQPRHTPRAADHADHADHAGHTVRVRPGDSLWSISARVLGPAATAGAGGPDWQRLHARNASTIGVDPDVIHPGQQLRLPPSER